ncbi:hypothetical protein PIB30_071441 [Stylosanthes scabra]|uniref:Protein-serine/threonine phosphatase n=1 Tax=Stylosanthes scabra TaxID=79078 RepID=A0ABU6VPT0_9FABA|nr:hypothetical protein [Stylosanthes scabra]
MAIVGKSVMARGGGGHDATGKSDSRCLVVELNGLAAMADGLAAKVSDGTVQRKERCSIFWIVHTRVCDVWLLLTPFQKMGFSYVFQAQVIFQQFGFQCGPSFKGNYIAHTVGQFF